MGLRGEGAITPRKMRHRNASSGFGSLVVAAVVPVLIGAVAFGIGHVGSGFNLVTSWNDAPPLMSERVPGYLAIAFGVPIVALVLAAWARRRSSIAGDRCLEMMVWGSGFIAQAFIVVQVAEITSEIDPDAGSGGLGGWLVILGVILFSWGAVRALRFVSGDVRLALSVSANRVHDLSERLLDGYPHPADDHRSERNDLIYDIYGLQAQLAGSRTWMPTQEGEESRDEARERAAELMDRADSLGEAELQSRLRLLADSIP